MFIFFLPEEVSAVFCSVIGDGSSVLRFIFALGSGESFIGERSGEVMIVSRLMEDGWKALSASANQSGSGCVCEVEGKSDPNPKGKGPLRGEDRLPGQMSKEMGATGALGSNGNLLLESRWSASSSTISVDLVLGVRLPMSGVLLGDDVLSLVGKVDQVYRLFNNRLFRVFRVFCLRGGRAR